MSEMDQFDREQLKRSQERKERIAMRREKRKRALMIRSAILSVAVVFLLGGVFLVGAGIKNTNDKKKAVEKAKQEAIIAAEEKELKDRKALIKEADRLAAGYDYDKALELIQGVEGYERKPEYVEAIAKYTAAKGKLVPFEDVSKVTHIFFHTLVAEPSITWNLTGKDAYKVGDYNQVMTTVDEFNAIMQQMYDNDFVLVSIRDLVKTNTDENGNVTFTKGEILLPEGKKPFVLSQDDVSYYFYMTGDGYASKLIVDDKGKITNEYIKEDGSVITGSFDVVPCLNDFIEKHPDFSYRGAKGILALTGYDGVLGYRTDPDLALTEEEGNKNAKEYGTFDVEAEIAAAKPVVQALKDDGWEFASHSYGHISYGSSFEKMKADADKWQERVANVIGPTDIIIYPFGTDIGDWRPYSQDNEKFQYLYGQGFRYFCNVDANKYWVQLGSNFVRQGRINVDGFRMYQDLKNGADRLGFMFDVESVYDKTRPETGLSNWDGAG